jgi:hypothetical protein
MGDSGDLGDARVASESKAFSEFVTLLFSLALPPHIASEA